MGVGPAACSAAMPATCVTRVLNGRVPAAPAGYQGRPGIRLRLRIVNAGGDTAFRVALGGPDDGHPHHGFPVEPVETDALLVGTGERYDALVTLDDGVFPLVALAEGKDGAALGLIRTGPGAAPAGSVRPAELARKILGYRELRPAEAVRLPTGDPDRMIELRLTGGMMGYDWAFDGRPYDPRRLVNTAPGQNDDGCGSSGGLGARWLAVAGPRWAQPVHDPKV